MIFAQTPRGLEHIIDLRGYGAMAGGFKLDEDGVLKLRSEISSFIIEAIQEKLEREAKPIKNSNQ